MSDTIRNYIVYITIYFTEISYILLNHIRTISAKKMLSLFKNVI